MSKTKDYSVADIDLIVRVSDDSSFIYLVGIDEQMSIYRDDIPALIEVLQKIAAEDCEP